MRVARNWQRYAIALDMHLDGYKLDAIAARFRVSRERARQLVTDAKAQLAFRVFQGIKRPRFEHHKEVIERRTLLTLLVLDAVEEQLAQRDAERLFDSLDRSRV